MIGMNHQLATITKGNEGISLLYWNPYENRLEFFNQGDRKIKDWSRFIGDKLKNVETELVARGSIPISIDDNYVHGILFITRRSKALVSLIEAIREWYLGIYLTNVFKQSSELHKLTAPIFRMKSPKKIIASFAEAVQKVLGGEKYELIDEDRPIVSHFSGVFPMFDLVFPFKFGDVRGIRIKFVKRTLPDDISLEYLENLAGHVNSYLDMALVRKRIEFLRLFSARFHDQKLLNDMKTYIEGNLTDVLDLSSVRFWCCFTGPLPEIDFNRARKGYIKKRKNGQHLYQIPMFIDEKPVGLLQVISITPLTRDDLNFLRFLCDEIKAIINLHVVSLRQERKILELKTVQEIADLSSCLSSPDEAYTVLAEIICKRTGFDRGLFVTVEGDEFVGHQPGYGLEEFPGPYRMKINQTEVMYSVYHSKKSYYANDLSKTSTITQQVARRYGVTRFVCFPYVYKDKVQGLFLAGRKPGSPAIKADDLHLPDLLINQSALLIQGLISSKELNHQLRELKLLNEISNIANSTLYLTELVRLTLKKMKDFIPHPYLSIFIYNEFSNNLELVGNLGYRLPNASFRNIKLGMGIIGNAALLRMTVLSNNVEDDNRYIKMLPDVNAELAIPILFQNRLLGIFDIQSGKKDAFQPEEVGFLSTIANQIAAAIENAHLHERVEETLTDTVRALVMTIDASDPYTRGHSERVTDYAVEIATELGLSRRDIEEIKKASLLHDIGKIGLSELILLKKEKLTDEEMDEVKLHPLLGAQMLDGVRAFEGVRNLIKCHHEGYNGDGYPYGLQGEEIPIGSRIITVADVYEALTSDRPYRPAYSKSQAIEILKSEAGGHLDPKVVSVFIKILNRRD